MTEQLCAYPMCPSGVNVKLLDERHKEIKFDLAEIKSNQREYISEMKDVHTLLADAASTRRDLERHEKAIDESFRRLHMIEETKATARDVIEMKERGMDWLWDVIKITVGALIVWIGYKIFGK